MFKMIVNYINIANNYEASYLFKMTVEIHFCTIYSFETTVVNVMYQNIVKTMILNNI